MYSVVIPITKLSNLVFENINALSTSPQIKQILLVDYKDSKLKYNGTKAEVVSIKDSSYNAISSVITNNVNQPNIILLDNNIQVPPKFGQKVTVHYAKNHLYSFKVNDIVDKTHVIQDSRVGNRFTPEMFTIPAIAFERSKAIEVGCFEGDLLDFVYKMVEIGVNIKLLDQVLCQRILNIDSIMPIDKKKVREEPKTFNIVPVQDKPWHNREKKEREKRVKKYLRHRKDRTKAKEKYKNINKVPKKKRSKMISTIIEDYNDGAIVGSVMIEYLKILGIESIRYDDYIFIREIK